MRDVISHMCVGYTSPDGDDGGQRRPLGMPREMPADRLVAALDIVPGLAGLVGTKQRTAGLRLVATDVDWSHGVRRRRHAR